MLDASIQSVCSHDVLCGNEASAHVIVEQRYLSQQQPSGMLNALKRRGTQITLHIADVAALCVSDVRFRPGDVVVGRGRSWPLFSMLRAAELAGALVINSASAITSVYDKAQMAVELSAAGIPTPRTWIGSPREICRAITDESFPLVIKPVFGDNGSGIALLHSRADLLRFDHAPVLAQDYIPNDGFDLKLYCIGEQVFAVRKPCAVECLRPSATASSAEVVPLTPALATIAHQCRLCFGLELFGVDCLMGPDGPLVIEVNEFPNYSAVPDASDLLAEYLCRRGSARCSS